MTDRNSVRYLGLDLAWAPRNSSGGAVMEATDDGVSLVSSTSLRAHEDILGWVARNRGRHGTVLVANAPIIVENSSGRRKCDQQLEEHFKSHLLDEVSVNTVNASHPRTMGRALMRMGFEPDPQAEGDRIIETNTQAVQILLFDLDRPIRLKSGPVGARKDAVARFRELMEETLMESQPPLAKSAELDDLLDADLGAANGTRVGELEERLQATVCAYIASYVHLRGLADCAFLGDLRDGYVLLPTTRQPAAV